MDDKSNVLFKANKICKTFGPITALNKVDIELYSGKIMGLIGENGSGKSTLSSICSGIQGFDSGEMFLNGESYSPSNTVDAIDKGICMTVQEQGTISLITVAANIFFGKEKQFVKHGILNVKQMVEKAQQALTKIGVTHIDASKLIDEYSLEDRKLVELARALYITPKIWIVDETTTALTVNGRDILYKLMDDLRSQGGAVLFISHDIEEIMRMCDSVTILRDGELTANLNKQDFSDEKIRQLMIGRDLSGHYYREDNGDEVSNEISLEALNIVTSDLKDVSIKLHKSEILGIGGLSDCGMHQLGKVLFGLEKYVSGTVKMGNGKVVKNPSWAVDHGIAYVSKNRDREAMMTICSIKDNICLPSLKDIKKWNLVLKKDELKLADEWSKKMEVKANNSLTFCNTLSGGNKQKVVLAKWLAKGADILILDCPTRGIDVGTKASIYQLIEQLKSEGKSIIILSEELPELIGMCDRIVVLKHGKVSGEFHRSEGVTEAKLIQKMI